MTPHCDLFSLALRHQQAGDLPQAEALCRQILEGDAAHADALNLLGMLSHQAGRNEAAVEFLRRAAAARPDDGTIHYNLGVAHQVLGRLSDAAACYRESLRLRPDHADAHNKLGIAYRELREKDKAAAHFRRAAELAPDRAAFHSNLANLLTSQGQPEEALRHYLQAVRIEPDEAAHHSNLGNVHILLGRPDEAERYCREALRLRPDLANALHNLAIARSLHGELDEAININERALRLGPDHAGAPNCQALWSLQKGDFERGWREYRWRWDIPGASPRDFTQPAWDGSALSGRVVLLHAEQGLGDTLQFIRYAPLVKARGGMVIVECQPALVPFLRSCPGIDQVVATGEALPPIDVQAPLLSLPRIFGTTPDTIPAAVPYFFADPALVERWRRELGGLRAFKVGIVWQGSPTHLWDRQRSIPLDHFAGLAAVPGVRLISLQQGYGREQAEAVADRFAVLDCSGRGDESGWDFADTATFVKNLDLVVTCDTSMAHLAGALGAPVWVALSHSPDWRWQLGRPDCPWYPTARLFRQDRPGDWDGVFARMAQELRKLTGPVVSAEPVRPVPIATICILTYGDHRPYFERCLESILATTPRGPIELRLGFNDSPASRTYARERLGLDDPAECRLLAGNVRQYTFVTGTGMTVRLWDAPVNLYKEPMARLMYHDVPLISEYAVWFDDDSFVEPGWWEALLPLLVRRVDYIGQRWWVDYLPGQEEMIRAQPWYRGVPFDRRERRPGVWFMTGGFLAVHAERLRESDFPNVAYTWKGDQLKQYGGGTLLGEIARQLGWTRAVHDVHIKVNVDLRGNHPAPRRGGTGNQFGADVDVAIR